MHGDVVGRVSERAAEMAGLRVIPEQSQGHAGHEPDVLEPLLVLGIQQSCPRRCRLYAHLDSPLTGGGFEEVILVKKGKSKKWKVKRGPKSSKGGLPEYDSLRWSLVLACAVLVACLHRRGLRAQTRPPVEQYVAARQQQIVREFVELLSIPNVAADRDNVRRNADLLRDLFASAASRQRSSRPAAIRSSLRSFACPARSARSSSTRTTTASPSTPKAGASPARSRRHARARAWKTADRRFRIFCR